MFYFGEINLAAAKYLAFRKFENEDIIRFVLKRRWFWNAFNFRVVKLKNSFKINRYQLYVNYYNKKLTDADIKIARMLRRRIILFSDGYITRPQHQDIYFDYYPGRWHIRSIMVDTRTGNIVCSYFLVYFKGKYMHMGVRANGEVYII